jgi:valyl-tRNA synthetase
MEKSYTPSHIETKWQEHYESIKIGEPKGSNETYCIMIPPPNVTGTLHMGHGFQLTLMDTMIRYQRMLGKKTLWQMGTDHAGIATQMIVERQLKQQGTSKEELGRDAFLDKAWEWSQFSGTNIKNQIKRIGASVDWDTEKFTLDKSMSDAVTTAFVKLYRDNLIYKGSKLINWDPVLKTAVSDLEVINEEADGNLWYIKYPIMDSDEFITVATTRPETMFGDTAVAISPDDTRHKKHLGKMIQLPLSNKTIPIIEDDHIDPEFGTGFVKVTPAHDFNDYEIGKRHNLPLVNIFTPEACMNENTPTDFIGLDRFTARKLVLEKLTELGLLAKTEPHKMVIPKGDRSGAIIEPYLTKQWFVSTEKLAEPAIDVVRNGKLKFHPKNWENTYFNWLENIEDWCISRQLWWGHRIPAWYDDAENIYVGFSEEDVRKHYNLDSKLDLYQDNDVLDTWFSSALWPFATLGWPEKTVRLDEFFPNNLLVTGFDIIFFWVARMVMFSLKFTGTIPFTDVYTTGLIKDFNGQKMSKSKGNIINPLDLIDGASLDELITSRTSGMMQPEMKQKVTLATKKEFPDGMQASGTDALRFTFAALATPGRDIRFDANRLVGYRNFCNKIWNAARYILINIEEQPNKPAKISHPVNIWLSGILHDYTDKLKSNIESYRFDLFSQNLYELIWDKYCDWYLELTKPILKSDDIIAINETKYMLFNSLRTLLKLAHPLLPFITEEIYAKTQELANDDSILALSAYPSPIEFNKDISINNEIETLQLIIGGARKIRSEMGISPGKKINIIAVGSDKNIVDKYSETLKDLVKINTISWKEANDEIPASATYIVGKTQFHIPLADIIDKDSEIKRLEKAIKKLEKSLTGILSRLNNENYVKNAPEQVVAKERDNALSQQEELQKLQDQMKKLETI